MSDRRRRDATTVAETARTGHRTLATLRPATTTMNASAGLTRFRLRRAPDPRSPPDAAAQRQVAMGAIVPALLFVASVLSGCAGRPAISDLADRVVGADLPTRALLEDIPFYPDERFFCGPAVAATLLDHRARQSPPGDETTCGAKQAGNRFNAQSTAKQVAIEHVADRIPQHESAAAFAAASDGKDPYEGNSRNRVGSAGAACDNGQLLQRAGLADWPLQPAGDRAAPPLGDLIEELFIPAREGAFQAEVRAAVRARDWVALRLDPEPEAVFKAVASGHPVAVFQNLGLRVAPAWHFAVVIGYDLERELVIEHSADRRALQTPLVTWLHSWTRGGNWAFVALPPEQPPSWVQPLRWLTAVAELEHARQLDAALIGYAAIAERLERSLEDPAQIPVDAETATDRTAVEHSDRGREERRDQYWVANMAMANTHITAGRPREAAEILITLLRRDEFERQRDPTWNNLAHALADAGYFESGRKAASCAVGLAERRLIQAERAYGPTRERFFGTTSEIESGSSEASKRPSQTALIPADTHNSGDDAADINASSGLRNTTDRTTALALPACPV
ncbi:MAG: PA2778 family cysteine peptidase [Thioalkalivibrionaceae bacterium]